MWAGSLCVFACRKFNCWPRFLKQVFYFLHNKAKTLHALNLHQEICTGPIKAHPFRLGPLGARLAFTLVLNEREIKM